MASTSRVFSAPEGTEGDRVQCPCCPDTFGPREILRHVNNQHAPLRALTGAQLSSIGATLCECGKVQSASGKGKHTCLGADAGPGPRRKRPRSAGRADRALAIACPFPATAPEAGLAIPHSLPVAFCPANGMPLVTAMEGVAEAGYGPPVQETQDLPAAALPAATVPSPAANIRYAASTVPHKAQSAFAEVCIELVRRVISTAGTPDHEQARADLLQLPSLVLWGKHSSQRRFSHVLTHIRKYRAGLCPHQRPTTANQRTRAERTVAQRAMRNLQRGSVTRASRDLDAAEALQATAQVLEKLEALHPDAPPPTVPNIAAVPVQINRKQLQEVLQRLPRGSAPGPSGWTFEHIKAIAQGNPQGISAILEFVNAALAGHLPVWEALRACRLIPLRKHADGVRPIAIGEVWLRLVGKCAMAVSSDVGKHMAPLQLGVGVPGGAQCIGHAVQAGLSAHTEHVTLQIDCKNAFNSLCRTSMLNAIAVAATPLLPLADWMYSAASPLLVPGAPANSSVLWSKQGVRQGDPCGPLFFALAVQPILQSLSEAFSGVRIIAYLDDIVLQGPTDDVQQAHPRLTAELVEVGLQVQPGKSCAYSAHGAAAQQLADELGVKLSEQGLVVAGCPVGQPSFVQEHVTTAVDSVVTQVSKLQGLSEMPVQGRLLLLRKSLQLKAVHFLRCVDSDLLQEPLSKLEQSVCDMFLSLIERDLNDVDADQLYLPLRFGGVGLQRWTPESGVVCKAGYLAAAALTQTALADGYVAFQPLSGTGVERLDRYWESIKPFLSKPGAMAGAGATAFAGSFQEACDQQQVQGLQRAVSQTVTEQAKQLLFSKYEARLTAGDHSTLVAEQHLARLHSLQQGIGTAWMNAVPTKPTWELSNASVTAALRFMLGVDPTNRSGAGHDAMSSQQSKLWTLRHDQLQSTVQFGAVAAGHSSSIEPQERHLKDLRYGDAGYGKRGDVLVSTVNDLLNIDVVVTHPACDTYRAAAAKRPGAANRVAERRKQRGHGGGTGHRFVPFAIESYGRLGDAAVDLLKVWADDAATGGAVSRDAFLVWLKRELSVALMKGNARMFERFVCAVPEQNGQRYLAGYAIPTVPDE